MRSRPIPGQTPNQIVSNLASQYTVACATCKKNQFSALQPGSASTSEFSEKASTYLPGEKDWVGACILQSVSAQTRPTVHWVRIVYRVTSGAVHPVPARLSQTPMQDSDERLRATGIVRRHAKDAQSLPPFFPVALARSQD